MIPRSSRTASDSLHMHKLQTGYRAGVDTVGVCQCITTVTARITVRGLYILSFTRLNPILSGFSRVPGARRAVKVVDSRFCSRGNQRVLRYGDM